MTSRYLELAWHGGSAREGCGGGGQLGSPPGIAGERCWSVGMPSHASARESVLGIQHRLTGLSWKGVCVRGKIQTLQLSSSEGCSEEKDGRAQDCRHHSC